MSRISSKGQKCKRFLSQFNKDLTQSKENNRPMLIAASYKKKAEELKKYIEKANGSKENIKLVTGKTTEEEGMLDIIREFDKHLSRDKLTYLIYSPAITTGVDIRETKGTNVYHFIDGILLGAHTHYQMTMRGRNARKYKVLMPLYLADNGYNEETDSDKVFSLGLLELFENVKFRGKYLTRTLKDTVGNLKLKMGSLLTFKALEESHSKEEKIKRMIGNNSFLDLINCEGVKTAIRLEKACIEWESYDRKYGVLGQYRNLLAREGCLVSVQTDSKPKKSTSKTSKNYLEQSKKAVREELNYRGELKAKSQTSTYEKIRKIKTGQRILNSALNNCEKSSITVKTTHILESTLKPYGLSFKSPKPVKLTNNDCVKIYESLVNKVYSSENNIEPEIDKLLKKGVNIPNSGKIKKTTSILKFFFYTQKKRKARVMEVKLNMDLVESVKDMDENHEKNLYR